MAAFGDTIGRLTQALLARLGIRARRTLPQQLQDFADIGVTLNPGVTIDDLEYSFSAGDYEDDPYRLLFFMLGGEVEREPWGRRISAQVWNLDLECIEGPGSYADILRNLTGLAGRPEIISDISDPIGADASAGELSYCIGGRRRAVSVRVQDDWADTHAVTGILRDIENALDCDRRFWCADNGQATVLTFLTDADAKKINTLCKDLLVPA